jgi:hypothetical protein
LSTAAQPPDAAPQPAAPEPEPAPDTTTVPRKYWRERLRSPTLREIAIGVAVPLIGGAVAFGVREIWGLLHQPAASGSITYKGTVDAFVSRDDFYKRFVHAPAPSAALSGMGAVFLVQAETHHASNCGFVYTARNVGDQTTVGDLVDEPADDVAGGSGCGGQKRVWIPWPCVVSDTRLQFELDLVSGSKQLDSATTEKFTIGGSC